jgi:hypothetical protein
MAKFTGSLITYPIAFASTERVTSVSLLFRYEVFSEVRVSWVQDKMGGVAEGSANILKQCQ